MARNTLPPLSSLLNSPRHRSLPSSPKDTTGMTLKPLGMKTPVRLPSFDSLQFDTLKPTYHHSHSFSGASSTPAPLQLPTPQSQQQQQQEQLLLQKQSNPLSHSYQKEEPREEAGSSPLVEKRAFAFISHDPRTFPLQEPSIDNEQLARRKRRRTSPGELSILQAEFCKGQTPNRARRVEIANRVNMTEKAVQIWFQNRRQTLRRQSNTQREVHHLELPQHHQQAQFTQHMTHASSPPQSSSPIANTSVCTPSRPPRLTEKSPSTQTFRLVKQTTNSPDSLKPVITSFKTRQKPVMRVNSQPAMDMFSSSPVNKENSSPQSSPRKNDPQSSPSKRKPLGELSYNEDMKPKTRDDDAVLNLLSLKNLTQ